MRVLQDPTAASEILARLWPDSAYGSVVIVLPGGSRLLTVFRGEATNNNACPPSGVRATSTSPRSQGVPRAIVHDRTAKGVSVLGPGSPPTEAAASALTRDLAQRMGAGQMHRTGARRRQSCGRCEQLPNRPGRQCVPSFAAPVSPACADQTWLLAEWDAAALTGRGNAQTCLQTEK